MTDVAQHQPAGHDARPRAWLVRHGETEWSLSGQHTGRTDVALTDAGETQARVLGSRLAGHAFALALSSPMRRALDTARLAGFGDRTVVDPDLCEWNYGEYEGITTAQIRETVPGWTVWTHPIPGGESRDEVENRVDRAVERIRAADGDVAVFAHGHILRVLAARWIGLRAADGRRLSLRTATVSVLGWERETPVIDRWNEAPGSG
ncbi:MAG TPA: histidine phosphatase family protein [Vitreimonas sp.]|nr:histidine phosphatase family protein [Vitreimonas sp.]